MEKKILDCETNLEQFRNTLSKTTIEEDIFKDTLQILYDKGFFDKFSNKDQVFESYIKLNEAYLLKKNGKYLVKGSNFYFLSDLRY